MSLEKFVNQHIQLLDKEREAEIEETRYRRTRERVLNYDLHSKFEFPLYLY